MGCKCGNRGVDQRVNTPMSTAVQMDELELPKDEGVDEVEQDDK